MRRGGRVVLLVAGGIFFALLLAAVFRGPLLEPLIVLAVRRTLGLHATIARVGGSALGGLELQGVSARNEAGAGPVTAFAAERISARYALAALLRGKEAFLESLDVTVAGARLDLDLTGSPASAPAAAGRPSFPRLPRLTVSDARLRLRGQGFSLEADGLQGTVARADQAREQAVELRAERFSLRHPALREGTVALAVAGRYGPRRLLVTAARVNDEPLVERGSLELGERRGEGDLQLALALWGGSLEIGALRGAAGTDVRWEARGVDLQPGRLLVSPALGALRGQLTTNGSVRLGREGLQTLTGVLSLDWTGALLAGRAVDRLIVEAAAERGVVRVERAQGRIGANELQVNRVELPAAPLLERRWRALLAAASGTFTASFGDLPAFLALWGVGAVDGAAPVPEHRLRLEGSLERGRVRLARGELAAGPGTATLAAVTVALPREDQGWGETAFSGSAAIDIPNLQDLSALFPLPPLSGSLRGEISGAGTFARPEGRASLTGRGIVVAGRRLGDVQLQARGTAGRVEIDTLQVQLGGNRLNAQQVRFLPATLAAADRSGFIDGLTGSFALSAADLPALAALAGLPPEALARLPAALLTAAGTVRGRAIAVTGSLAAAGGSISLRGGRVAVPPPPADWKRDTTLEGDLVVDLPDLEPLAAIFQLPPLQGALDGQVRLAGSAGAPSGHGELSGRGIAIGGHRVGDVVVKASADLQLLKLEALEISRGGDRLRGRGSFDLERQAVLAAEADLDLADVAPYLAEFVRKSIPVSGRLHVGLRTTGPLPGAPLDITAGFSGGRLGVVQEVRATAEARLSVQGTLRQPRIGLTARVSGTSGGPAGRPLRASFDATYVPGQVRIGAFELAGAGDLAASGEGTLPVDLAADDFLSAGPISIRAQASIPALEDLAFLLPPASALAGTVRASLSVTGSWKQPEARLEIAGERLLLPAGTRFAPPGPATLAGTLTWGKAQARADAVRLESSSLSATLSGTWSSPPSLASLFARDGGAATGTLSLRTSFVFPDIGWLRDAVAGLRGLHGSVAGELAVEGPAGDPALSGEIRIADASLRFRDLPPIDTLTARAAVARRRVTLKECGGNVGGSPFTLAGSLDFAKLDDPIVDLRLLGTNALLYRAEGLRVRADSDLTLRGPLSALVLAGEVALTDSLYQKNFSVARLLSGGDKGAKRRTPGLSGLSFPHPPLRDMRFDVRIVAREPFQIRNNVVRGGARPDLRLTGTGLLPLLRGPILVDAARVLFPSGSLELERGTVLYRESDPDRPALDFGGRMHAGGYDITVQIGGTLDSPEVILSSTPPLPREELLLFVLTGAPPGSAGTDRGAVAAMASPMAVYFGRGVLEQLLGGGSQDGKADLHDRIELQVGRELTRSGSMTVDARLLLKRNPFAHDSALYFTSDKDVYDQYNAGLKVIFKFK